MEPTSERRPPPGKWEEIEAPADLWQPETIALSGWRRANTIVLSVLGAEDGESSWALRVSTDDSRRIDNPHWVSEVLSDFGMSGAHEAEPGSASANMFWMPVPRDQMSVVEAVKQAKEAGR